MKKVYDDTSGAAHPTYTGCITSFGDLEVCPVEELERIMKSAPCKSCEIDPVPTFLLLECLDILLPFIHIMCNSSLTSGTCATRISEEGYRHTKVEESRE